MTLVACDRGVNPAANVYSCSAGAALFDGTNDWLKLSNDFSGNYDGSRGIFSIWLNYTSGSAINRILYTNFNSTVVIERTSAGKFQVTLRSDAIGTNRLIFTGSTIYGIGGIVPFPQDFAHVIFAWDTNYPAGSKKCQIYFNGLAETLTISDPSPAFTIDYTDNNGHAICADINGGGKWAGSVGGVYWNNTEYLDLSNPLNLAKWRYIDQYGSQFPAMMGSNGQLPTNSVPIVFLNNDMSFLQNNRGYGGGFSLQGALAAADPATPCRLGLAGGVFIGD